MTPEGEELKVTATKSPSSQGNRRNGASSFGHRRRTAFSARR
jgi:hypothetical protein